MTCVWTPDTSTISEEWEAVPEAVRDRALRLATSSLLMLTYNRVGTCPVTIRPCVTAPCGCSYKKQCKGACIPPTEIELPGPVGYVEAIKVNGQYIDVDEHNNWRIDNGNLLVWQGDGPSPIPAVQDLGKPDTEPGTWSITYSQSHPVGPDGRFAVALLAMEFVKAMQPKGKCALPKGVTNVVRNGVSFTVDSGLFLGGLTGIEVVDQFIMRWVPVGSPLQNAYVFDPSKHRPRRSGPVLTQAPSGGFGVGGFGQ